MRGPGNPELEPRPTASSSLPLVRETAVMSLPNADELLGWVDAGPGPPLGAHLPGAVEPFSRLFETGSLVDWKDSGSSFSGIVHLSAGVAHARNHDSFVVCWIIPNQLTVERSSSFKSVKALQVGLTAGVECA